MENEVAYKLGPEIEPMAAKTEESLSDPTIPEPSPATPTPNSRKTAAPQPRDEASPSRGPHWRDINLSSFEYPETPFK